MKIITALLLIVPFVVHAQMHIISTTSRSQNARIPSPENSRQGVESLPFQPPPPQEFPQPASYDPNSGYIPKPDDYRIFQGKLYNAALSTNWITFAGADGYLEVETVGRKSICCNVMEPLSYGGFNQSKTILIYNYPRHDQVVTGEKILEPTHCIRVENYSTNSIAYEAYDYGFLNTPENRKKYLGLEPTVSPANLSLK